MFRTRLNNRYFSGITNKNLTNGEYIIKSLMNKKINHVFGYNQNMYTPFFKIAKNIKDFHLMLCDSEEYSGKIAINFSKNTGVIISTSTYGFRNICNPLKNAYDNEIPLLLLSFYNKEDELKSGSYLRPERKFLKEYYTVRDNDNISKLIEYMLLTSESPRKGPVHLNICNKYLNDIYTY